MMKKVSIFQQGLTLIELVVVIAILSLLFGLSTVSVLNIRSITVKNTTATVIVSDLKLQQIKAMTGDTEGRGTPDNYGIKILLNKYVLFHGNSYDQNDSANFSIPLDSGYSLSTTFSGDQILFASQSGEIVGYTNGQDQITLTNSATSKTQTIHLNKYGTITSIN